MKSAVKYFHSKLKYEVKSLRDKIIYARDGSFFEWFKAAISFKEGISYEDFFNLLSGFDINERNRAFQYATHFYEAKWILETKKIIGKKEGKRSEESWKRQAMITPLFVSTFNMAPRFFSSRFSRARSSKSKDKLMQPLIDLLIVDEAGQASSEVGGPCFGLAKKALVVGDTRQLEPVWSVPKHLDLANAKKHGLLKKKKEDFGDLSKFGFTASDGNLMKLAVKTCGGRSDSIIGVFLSEHRRSVPEIVSFCNSVAYSGRLVPKREELNKRIFPAIGFMDVSGRDE